MAKCKFKKAWVGICGKEALPDKEVCAEHAEVKCVSCGAPAVRECPETSGLVCGAPLCDDCGHTTYPNGCNSGFNPDNLKSHCRKDKQVYRSWLERNCVACPSKEPEYSAKRNSGEICVSCPEALVKKTTEG